MKGFESVFKDIGLKWHIKPTKRLNIYLKMPKTKLIV